MNAIIRPAPEKSRTRIPRAPATPRKFMWLAPLPLRFCGDLWADAEGLPLKQPTIDWLLQHDVRIEALASPIAVRTATAIFLGGGRYAPSINATPVLILPEVVDDELIDLVAWDRRGRRLASRLGGRLLGGAAIFTDAPITIHRDPLAWLQAGRAGCVIIPRRTCP